MRLCCRDWLTRLTVLMCVFCSFSASSSSKVPFFYDNADLRSAANNGNLLNGSTCQLDDTHMIKEGDPNAGKDDVVINTDGGYFTINYGERGNYFAVVGKFRYSESFPINISSSFRPTLTEAFKKALKSGNCTLANELANQLKNGEPKQCGEHLCVGFEDGNGGRCYTRTLVPSLAFFIVSLIISGVKLLSSLT